MLENRSELMLEKVGKLVAVKVTLGLLKGDGLMLGQLTLVLSVGLGLGGVGALLESRLELDLEKVGVVFENCIVGDEKRGGKEEDCIGTAIEEEEEEEVVVESNSVSSSLKRLSLGVVMMS